MLLAVQFSDESLEDDLALDLRPTLSLPMPILNQKAWEPRELFPKIHPQMQMAPLAKSPLPEQHSKYPQVYPNYHYHMLQYQVSRLERGEIACTFWPTTFLPLELVNEMAIAWALAFLETPFPV